MDSIDKLAEIFKEFPGIGERQARRFVYFLMSRNNGYTENIAKLIADLKKKIGNSKELKEIILAFSLSPQGDHTDHYIRSELKDLGTKISSLGRGLSTGTELEYSDNETLKNALKNRQ